MKKILTISTAFMFMLFFLFINIGTTSSAGTVDQQCMLLSDTFNSQMAGRGEGNRFSQTFTPTYNRLTGIKLFFTGDGKGQVLVDLYNGTNLVATSNTTNEPNGWGVSTFVFSDLPLTPGNSNYEIIPRLIGNSSLFWHFKQGCYSRGVMYTGVGAPNNLNDFGFATYGYNATGEPVAPPETPATPSTPEQGNQTNGATTNNIVTGTTGEKPKEPSKDIVPPKELSASSGANSISLKWKPSTTQEVDGYKIFRSEKENEGFEGLGEVNGSTYEFKDSGAEKGKTYYYFIRATVGTDKESASSNTVSVKAKTEEAVKSTAKNDSSWFIFLGLPFWQQVIFAGGILLVLILLGFLAYRITKQHKINKERKGVI